MKKKNLLVKVLSLSLVLFLLAGCGNNGIIFAEISKENPIRKAAAEDKSEEIFDSLRDSTLEIVSTLGQAQLSLRDIYHLNVGDVIDLGRSKQSSVYLDIGGYHWFTGKMGTHKKNMAVRIDEVCYQAEQRSEEAI